MTNYQLFKKALANKLADEGTYFTAQDIIKIRDYENGFAFTIKDYECIRYHVYFDIEKDDYFAKRFGQICAHVSTNDEAGIFCDWYRDIPTALERVALNIGYEIGTTY